MSVFDGKAPPKVLPSFRSLREHPPSETQKECERSLGQMTAMLGGAMEGVLRALVYDHGVHWRQLSIADTTQDPMYRRIIVFEEGKVYVAGHVHGYFGGRNGWRFLLDARAYPRNEWRS